MIELTIPCKVIPVRNGVYRRPRRGVPECKSGETLYFLWHEPTGLYFKECYVNEAYAISKAARTCGPRGMSEVAEYWVTDTKHCEHSYRQEDKE